MNDAGSGSRVDSAVDSWAREAFRVTTERPGVHRVGLAVLEGGGRRLRFTASDRDDDQGVAWCHIDAYDDVPLTTAVRKGESVLAALDDLDPRYADFVERQQSTSTEAVGAVPMVAAGQVVGACIMFYDRLDAFAAEEPSALTALANDLGADLRRSRRYEDRAGVDDPDTALPPTARSATHRVPPDPAEVGVARRFLRTTLVEWGVDDGDADTAILCLSELVTNAVIHTHGVSVVQIGLDRGVLTVRVRDTGAGVGLPTDRDDPLRVHGRGLKLVEALSSRWGSELDARGATVWFVLDLDHWSEE